MPFVFSNHFVPTADMYDTYLDTARVIGLSSSAGPSLHHYGGQRQFRGQATTVKCFEDNSRIQEIACSTPHSDSVLVVDAGGSTRCAVMGDRIAQTACENGWKGVIIFGCVRDVAILRQISMGVVALGSTPRKSTRRGEGQSNLPVQVDGGVTVQPGDLIFCDEDGILILNPKDYHATKFSFPDAKQDE